MPVGKTQRIAKVKSTVDVCRPHGPNADARGKTRFSEVTSANRLPRPVVARFYLVTDDYLLVISLLRFVEDDHRLGSAITT